MPPIVPPTHQATCPLDTQRSSLDTHRCTHTHTHTPRTTRHVTPRHVTPRHATPRRATLCPQLRLLNAGHSALSYVSYLCGHRFVDAAMNDPKVTGYLMGVFAEHTGPYLWSVSVTVSVSVCVRMCPYVCYVASSRPCGSGWGMPLNHTKHQTTHPSNLPCPPARPPARPPSRPPSARPLAFRYALPGARSGRS